jgi:arginine/lysine/ornithine decarboxylase
MSACPVVIEPDPSLFYVLADHKRAPLLEALQAAREAGMVPFTAPGHKGGVGADAELLQLLGADLFRSDIWLNTRDFEETLREAEQLAAHTWGAERAYFLVNGSSSGNHAYLLATVAPGDEVIVARDIHKSLLVGLILSGARPVYVNPRFDRGCNVSLGIDPTDLGTTLAAHPEAKLVALVSPNYHGLSSDIRALAQVAHEHGAPLYVDQAWGPHFGAHPELPESAIDAGADGAVVSVHKLMGSLSQGAILFTNSPRVNPSALGAVVAMTQTTSPLLPLLASIDAARRQIALHGEQLLNCALYLAHDARRRLNNLPGISVLTPETGDWPVYDPTRLVIEVRGLGLTGFQAEQLLRERFAIAPEMSDFLSVICLVTAGDTPDTINRLVAALATLAGEYGRPLAVPHRWTRSLGSIIADGEQTLTPREAFYSARRNVPLAQAAGEIAAEMIVPYPPGVPLLLPGETISAAKIDYLTEGMRHGVCIRGAADPGLLTIQVVA